MYKKQNWNIITTNERNLGNLVQNVLGMEKNTVRERGMCSEHIVEFVSKYKNVIVQIYIIHN